ncbi:MAG: hypothetical protein A3G49_02510 [Candidatus Sungbacteria bacterium RIFCSPLOWO2_12_FULL_41_11]|uniref:peptide chain release factor N(5)-glutamine methyltransferase n=1 Tax=Candidatus Sungbacteria bacterium RIFCSPLOWO2_12_FULL_41_11 TaxID=1802286 RepID=A0A1G2LNW1_9BACT|nr:MAG: Protoporphyrinogen oxidase [Parcubacteria group bacterium GW2011_GWA2_42_14]OGZ97968.1 MAG: hypothetical protein A3D41_04505 [Candidatus Sungbacteria bacterium RIFCSPHIGHO2_02_FULL_41_12b]OHA13214.1 MAG: hypothetical protein A3G49_02510 [Candidatus Sungbacteria bacterium RIFCSPLOWO2_12_FULL_41_11]
MIRHLNLSEKTEERLQQEIKWLLDEKYDGHRTSEAEQDIERLKKGEPVDYVIGRMDFCGCTIDLSLRPLIPRTSTEYWAEKTIESIKKRGLTSPRCLDMFAGSGCVGIAILKHIPGATVDFVDIDPDALKQIEINLKLNDISPNRARIIHSDVFQNVTGMYDIIASNPPYFPLGVTGLIAKFSLAYESHHFYFAGEDGLSCIRPFLQSARKHVKEDGEIWLDYASGQKSDVERLLREYGYANFIFSDEGMKQRQVVIMSDAAFQAADPFFDFFDADRPVVDPLLPEWKEVSYKDYPRSTCITLPKPELPQDVLLETVLEKRKSERDFSDNPLPEKTISSLLYWSVGLINKNKNMVEFQLRRPYPSGGARYQVEIYAVLFNGSGLENGVYHYNTKEHALELIQRASFENIRQALHYDFAKKAAALILLSFVGGRTLKKYGNLGYKLGLLEGGHIGQNIYLVGTALGLGVLALGGMDYEVVQKELDLGEDETVFYQLAIGWPK